MKKTVFFIAALFQFSFCKAQIREIPLAVEDAFTNQYPNAKNVEYKERSLERQREGMGFR